MEFDNFPDWLTFRIKEAGISADILGGLLCMSGSTIRTHKNGSRNPSFAQVIAYCWAFNKDDDPYDIYELVDPGITGIRRDW